MRWAIRSETRLYFLLLVHGHAHILYMHRIGCEGGVVSRRVKVQRHMSCGQRRVLAAVYISADRRSYSVVSRVSLS
jgi:hypothetical protein